MSSNSVSEKSIAILLPFLKKRGLSLTPYVDLESQLHKGDYRGTRDGIHYNNFEFKAEQCDKHGNLFIETWSNKSLGRKGWLHNLTSAHTLLYHFIDNGTLYVLCMEKLHSFDLQKYPEKLQRKYTQHNDTYGRCVPIDDLRKAGVISQKLVV